MKNSFYRIFFLPAFLLSIILLIGSCAKTATPAILVTLPIVNSAQVIINLTATSAQSGGTVTSAGNGTITANGVCYSSTNHTPTISNTKNSVAPVTGQTIVGQFSDTLTNLTPGTTYYLRAFGTNSAGTSYGSVITFTTSASLSTSVTTVTTFAGNGTAGYVNASGLSAQFNNPEGVMVDSKGNLYVSDSYNSIIREVTPAGSASLFAGTPQIPGLINGPVATAQFYAPNGSVFDTQGNLYVADFGNNIIRKITPAGTVSTYAGTGVAGYLNGAVDSARLESTTDSLAMFNGPKGLTIDAQNNLYVADFGNNVIRKITPSGRVITFAGTQNEGFANGADEYASFTGPSGLTMDDNGNIYVTDQGNSALRIITAAGVVSTIAGGPTLSNILNYPSGIAIDSQAANLYIVDEGGRIFQYNIKTRVLNVLAGTAATSGFVNGTGASALFNDPQGIAIDANGNIYVADQENNCIRKIVITQ